jgi:small subunit ribosomal protein S17
MSDDETKKDETTEPQDEPQQDAGPVADEDTSSSQAAGEASSSAPPASDAAEADAPAADEGSSDDAPAAKEAAPAEPDPEDDLPWKERRRLQRSRRPSKAKPALSPEDRAAARLAARKKKAAERRKERAAAKARKGEPKTGTPPAERDSNAAKVRQGIVVSNKGDKSITVRIDFARRHPTYEKIVRRSRTLHAHDESNAAGEGDVVRIVETRPLSKTKRWRLVDVVEKAR